MNWSNARSRITATVVALATATPLVLGGLSLPAPASAAGDTMRIEPGRSAVAKDETVRLRIIQNSSIATSGAQATITFDPDLLQIVSVVKGADYATAPVFAGASADQLATANAEGRLAGVAAAFLPPGSVPPGDREFLVVELKAIACGRAEVGLPVGPADAGILDGRTETYGKALDVAASGATINVCDTMRVEPAVAATGKDGTVRVTVRQQATVATSGGQATLTFDPALLQVVSVTKGADYVAAPVFAGAGQEQITAANTTGKLAGVATAFLPPGAVPAGDREIFVVEFKAIACGSAQIGLPEGPADAGLLDGRPATYGKPLTLATTGATIAICDTLRIDPPAATIAKDATVRVRVMQNAEVATSGAQVTISFDRGLLRLLSAAKGADYATASVFAGADAAAVAAANETGLLPGIAAAFLPPGSVAAGDREFLVVEFKAIGCGRSEIGLPDGDSDAVMLDGRPETYGGELPVTPIGGSVTICAAPKPAPSATPTPAPTATPTPTPTPAATLPPDDPGAVAPPPYVPPPDPGIVTGETLAPAESLEPSEGSPPPPGQGVLPSRSPAPNAPRASSGVWLDEDVAAVAVVGVGVATLMISLLFVLVLGGIVAAIVIACVVAATRRKPLR